MKLVITAGFDGSIPALALCELLRRSGHCIETVLVVTPYSPTRLKKMLRQRGMQGIKKVASKLLNLKKSGAELSLQTQFLIHKGISYSSLKAWCKVNEVKYILVGNLNSSKSINSVKQSNPDAILYAGGGILRSTFIEVANHKIVNSHSGPLPEIRGMNAVEWSILLGYEPSITIHMIDRGIDTGKIISRKRIPIGKGETIETLRDKAVISGVLEVTRLFDGLTDLDDLNKETSRDGLVGRQCYIMAPAVRELLSNKLEGFLND
mgnify:CR=1 FL=1